MLRVEEAGGAPASPSGPHASPGGDDVSSKVREVRHEGALLARQGGHPLRYGARSDHRGSARRHHQGHEPAPSAAPTCTSTTASCRAWNPATSWATSPWARSSRSGRDNTKLKVGDRVVVPFTIICGECDQCKRGNFSVCERTNRNKEVADKVFGHTTAGLFGYTHLTGGYPGGQAEYLRVPFADDDPYKGPGRHPGREASFPQRHLSDRLAGGGAMRHRADRHGRDLGLRACRPDDDPQRRPARREAGDRHRPRARAPRHGEGRRRDRRSTSTRRASSNA